MNTIHKFNSFKPKLIKENIYSETICDLEDGFIKDMDTKNRCECGNPTCRCIEGECTCESESEFDEVGGFMSFGEYETDNKKQLDVDTPYEDEVTFKAIPSGAIVSTEIELPLTCLQSDPDLKLNIPSFDPSYTSSPRDCSIVKCMTDKGLRVAVIYTSDITDDLDQLSSNHSMKDALSKAQKLSTQLNVPIHNHKSEEFIGPVPTCLIIKPFVDNSTSYKK